MPDIFDEVAPADIFDQIAGPDLFDEVADGPDTMGIGQEVRGVGRAVQRGALQGLQALDTMRLADVAARPPQFSDERRAFLAGRFAEQERALYGGRPERLAELAQAAESTPVQIAREISGRQQRVDSLPAAPDVANLRTDFWRTLASNPVETIATVVAESVPQAVPGMVGAAAGAGPVAVGANSFGIEYANSLLETAGPDVVRNPEALARWFAVPENQAAAKAKAVQRGIPVSAFDMATFGLAGRFLGPALGQGRGAVAVASLKELGTQMAGGMMGETTGQLASEGRITSVPDIVLEGIAELGGAPAEVFGNLRNEVGSRVREQMGVGMANDQGPIDQGADELPDFRELETEAAPEAPDIQGGEVNAQERNQERWQTLLSDQQTSAGLGDAPAAEGFTPIDQAVRQSRLGRMDPQAAVAEAVPAEGWTPVTSFIRREQMRPRPVTPKTAAPETGPTPEQRKASQEFDRLLIEIGPEAGWVDNLDALAPQMETAKQDATTITARLARGAELRKLRFRAAQAFGLDAAKMNLDVRERAQLLPALQAYVEKVIVPQRQADSLTAAIQPEAGKQPVNTGELNVGDVLNIDGEPVRVEAVDPDTGEVTLLDGTRFGRTTIADGQTIYVENVEQVAASTDFAQVEQEGTEGTKAQETQAVDSLRSATSAMSGAGSQASNTQAGKSSAPGAVARLAFNRPVQEPYSDRWSVSLQISNTDPSAFTNDRVRESLPPELRGSVYEIRRFQGEVVPTDKSLSTPGRVQITFANKAAADAAIRWFTEPAPRSPLPAPGVLSAPESVADQNARLDREAAQAKAKADRETLAERQAKPLTGSVGDIGQGDLLGGGDLFSAPAPKAKEQKANFERQIRRSGVIETAFGSVRINESDAVPGRYNVVVVDNGIRSIVNDPASPLALSEAQAAAVRRAAGETLEQGQIPISEKSEAVATPPPGSKPAGMSVDQARQYLSRPGQILGYEERGFLESQRTTAPRSALPAPSPTDKAIAALESLKVDTAGKVFDAIQGIPVAVWNGALSAAQLALRAGQRVAQAIDAALAYIRAQHRGDFDEAAVRAELENSLQQRQFAEQVDAAPDLAPAVKEATTNRFYTRKPNESTAAFAGRIITGVGGAPNAVAVFTDSTNGLGGAERTMLGQLIVKQLSAAGQHEAAARFLDDTFLPYSTEAAQALQAFAAFANLTPEGALIYAKRLFNRAQRQPRERIQPTLDTAVDVLDDLNRQGIEGTVKDGKVQAGARTAVDAGVEQAAGTLGTDLHTAVREHVLTELGKAGTVTPVEAERLRQVFTGRAGWREVFGDRAPAVERAYVTEWRRAMKLVRTRLQAVRQKLGPGMTETVLDTAIRNELQAQRLKLGRLVREHYRTVNAVGRSLTDRLVADAKLDPAAAADFARVVERRFAELVSDAKQRAIQRLEQVQPVPRELKQVWQRLVELSNLGALDRDTAWNAVAERLNLPQWTADIAKETQRLAQRVAETPEGITRQKRVIELHNYLARATGVPVMDTVLAFWYANTLSGPTTQAVNLLANVQNLVANLAIEARHPRDFVAQLAAVGRGLQQGGREAAEVLRTGILTRPGNTKLAASRPLELLQLPGRLDYLLTPFRLVGRALAAGDSLFFHAGQESRAVLLARQLARSEGLSGPALQRRVAEALGRSSRQRFRAVRQAVREGLSGVDLARRVDDLTLQQRPEGINDNARDYALRLTFNQKPYGLLGAIAHGINWAGAQPFGLPLRLVVPFTNVVANVANESLNYVPPIGVARAAWGHWKGTLEGQPITDRNALGDQWAKAALGTVLLGMVWGAAEGGLDDDEPWFMVNGAGPRETNKKNQLRATGWIPFSVKLGDRYVSFANSPVAMPLAAIGNYFDARRYRQLDEQDAWNRLAYGFTTMGKVILEQSFLDGIARIVGSLDRDNVNAGKELAQSIGRTAGNFVIPNAVRQVDRLFDPTVYDAATTEAALINSVPYARRMNRPALNVWGEPVLNELAKRFASTPTDDPLLAVLSRRGLWISAPSRTQTEHLNGQPMTPDEFYEFTRHRGQALKRLASRPGIQKALQNLPDEQAQRLWSRLQTAATRQAKAKVRPVR